MKTNISLITAKIISLENFFNVLNLQKIQQINNIKIITWNIIPIYTCQVDVIIIQN